MKCPNKNKICTRVLEKFLEGLEIFGSKKDFSILFYSSDTDIVGGKNHKTLATLDKEVLIRKYQEHILKCSECSDAYADFLKRQTNETISTEKADEKYLGLLSKIMSAH